MYVGWEKPEKMKNWGIPWYTSNFEEFVPYAHVHKNQKTDSITCIYLYAHVHNGKLLRFFHEPPSMYIYRSWHINKYSYAGGL